MSIRGLGLGNAGERARDAKEEDSYMESLNRMKESLLWAAAQGGNVQDCESLLKIGADVNWTSTDGDTCLLAASRRGHLETIVMLIKNKADVNAVGRDGQTALHICSRRGDIDAVRHLLKSPNIDIQKQNADGFTALDMTHQGNMEDVLKNAGCPRGDGKRNPNYSSSFSSDTVVGGESDSKSTPKSLPPSSSSSRRDSKLDLDDSSQVAFASISTAAESKSSDSNSDSIKVEPTSPSEGSNSRQSYTLMGRNGAGTGDLSNGDASTLALRKILDKEMKERQKSEHACEMMRAQIDMMRSMMEELKIEMEAMRAHVVEMEADREVLNKENNFMRGVDLDVADRHHCDDLEQHCREILTQIERRKIAIERETAGLDERRLCVVCQENEKAVVLLPCRHMCLCSECADHEAMMHCPLCRRDIINKFSVFS
jgi:hypothetical protein